MNMRDVKEYTEGFLVGQAVAYCEQVKLGSRSAGLIDCKQEYVDKLIPIAEQEGCSFKISLTEYGRAGFWIYKHRFVEIIIDHIQSHSNKEYADAFDIWIAGKLFGYADCEIADCISDNLGAMSK